MMLFIATSSLFMQAALVPGINPNADEIKVKLLNNQSKASTYEGNIVDINYNPICSSDTLGQDGFCKYGEQYAWIIGYNNMYGKYGIRKTFENYLWNYKDTENRGATLQLTTDNQMQLKAWDILSSLTTDGSIIILDNETAAVKAFVSTSGVPFNNNNVAEFMKEANKVEGSMYHRGIYEQLPPGSIWKLITAAASLESDLNQKELFHYYDTGTYYVQDADYELHNYANNAYGQLNSIGEALEISSNTYFAALAEKIGYVQFEKIANKFLMNETIELDFTTLYPRLGLTQYTPFNLTQSAIGQGQIQVCPLYIAMIGVTLANNGEMLAPYLIESSYTNKKIHYSGERKTLSQAISKKTAEEIKKAAHQPALAYGFDESLGYIFAKSGTAEINDTDIQSYLLAVSEKYTYLISDSKASSSIDLYQPMYQLINNFH